MSKKELTKKQAEQVTGGVSPECNPVQVKPVEGLTGMAAETIVASPSVVVLGKENIGINPVAEEEDMMHIVSPAIADAK